MIAVVSTAQVLDEVFEALNAQYMARAMSGGI